MSAAAGAERKAAPAKRKRRLACAECFRLREKCVYGDAADGDPCQRCRKLGKQCEARKPGGGAQRKTRKDAAEPRRSKTNACAECHRARSKCVQNSSGTCERCAAMGKVCTPHIVVRRTPQDEAEFEDELSRVCSSMSALCAFRDEGADLARTRKAAADMPVLINELRLGAVPPAMMGILRYMMFIAKVDGSLERLHKTTAMAAAMGAAEVVDALDTDAPPLPRAHMDGLTAHVVERFKLDDPSAGVFYLTSNVGMRRVYSNPMYNLFCTQATLEEEVRAGHAPVLESWRPFLVDKVMMRKIAEKCGVEIMTTATKVNTDYGPVFMVSCEEYVVEAVDLAGAHFRVALSLAHAVQEDGKFFVGAVRLRDVKPLDARACYRHWELLTDATDTESQANALSSPAPAATTFMEDDEDDLPQDLDTIFDDSLAAIPEPAPLPGTAMAGPAPPELPPHDPVMIPLVEGADAPPLLPPEQQDAADQLLHDLFSSP